MKRNTTLIIGFTIAGIVALVGFLSISYNSDNGKRTVEDVRNSSDCYIVRTDITMIQKSFSEGQNSPRQTSLLLDAARSDFSKAASSFNGAKADWLDKMAELTKKVSGYIISGIPEDGPKALEELTEKMNLVDQFCQ